MTDSGRGYQQFFAEMKRRHVFRVMAVYGATAFVLLQVADLLAEGMGLSDQVLRIATFLVLIGYPIAIVLAWAFESTPDGMRRTEDATPEEIEAIIAAPASQRLPAGLMALVGVIALVLGAWWVGRQTAPGTGAMTAVSGADVGLVDPADDVRPSIAVLPFANMSSDEEQEYFSDGMTEEILNTLVGIHDLRVAGRTSAFAYKGQNKDLRTIGEELGVRYLVEGSVRREGDELRITAQLIDAEDGSHLWSEQYDRRLQGVFAIQTEIAEAIADALKVPLGLGEAADLVRPLTDLDAYDIYLAARARMRARGVELNEAVRLYEAAIARDSNWAPAWAGLAEATELRLWYPEAVGGPLSREREVDGLASAERAARRALQLDPRNSSAYVALGSVLRDRLEWDASQQAYVQALNIDPDNAEAHHQFGELMIATGRASDAVRELDRAVILDPAPIRLFELGFALELDDRLEEAIAAHERGILLDPDGNVAALRRNLAGLYLHEGRYEEAAEVYSMHVDPVLAQQNRNRVEWTRGGLLSGVPDSARSLLNADDWLRFGEPDRAATTLAAFDGGLEVVFCYVVWHPFYDDIRAHPAVQAAMVEHGLTGRTLQRTPPDQRVRPASLQTSAR